VKMRFSRYENGQNKNLGPELMIADSDVRVQTVPTTISRYIPEGGILYNTILGKYWLKGPNLWP